MISCWICYAEHVPAVGTEERLLRDGTDSLCPLIDILQCWYLQLEMHSSVERKGIFLC